MIPPTPPKHRKQRPTHLINLGPHSVRGEPKPKKQARDKTTNLVHRPRAEQDPSTLREIQQQIPSTKVCVLIQAHL